jgi:hypothetical protein
VLHRQFIRDEVVRLEEPVGFRRLGDELPELLVRKPRGQRLRLCRCDRRQQESACREDEAAGDQPASEADHAEPPIQDSATGDVVHGVTAPRARASSCEPESRV